MGIVYLPYVYQIKKSDQNLIKNIKKYNGKCMIVGHNHDSAPPRDGKENVAKDFEYKTLEEALDSIIGEHEDTRIVFNMVCRKSSEILPPLQKQFVLLPEEDHFVFCKLSDLIDQVFNKRHEPEPEESVLTLSNVEISDLDLMMHALNKQYAVSGAVRLENGLLFAIKDKIFHLSLVGKDLSITTLKFFGVDLDDGFVCNSTELKQQLNSEYFHPFKKGNSTGELFPANKNNFPLKNIPHEDYLPPMLQILQATVKKFESLYGTQAQLTKMMNVFYHLNENEQEEYSRYIYMTNALLVAKMTNVFPEPYRAEGRKYHEDEFMRFLNYYLHVAKNASNSNTSLTCKIIGSCMMLLGLALIIAGTTLSILSLGIGIAPGAALLAGGGVVGASGLGLFGVGYCKSPSTIMANCGEQIAGAKTSELLRI